MNTNIDVSGMEIKMEREATTSTWGSFKMSVWHIIKNGIEVPLSHLHKCYSGSDLCTQFCRVDVLCIPGQKSKNPTLV